MRKLISMLIFSLAIIAMLSSCIFEEEDEKLKVVFNTAGGSQIETVEVLKGAAVERPDDPTKDGYVFAGWYLGDELYDFTKPIKRHTTLTAKWIKEGEQTVYCTVSFNTDCNDRIDSVTVIKNSTVKNPGAPYKEGFEFLGWYYGDAPFDFSEPIVKDLTLTARWKQIDIDKTESFVVTFDYGEILDKVEVTVERNKCVTKPNDPTVEGYIFCGWFSGAELYDFSTPIVEDLTLTALWQTIEIEIVEFTVTFDFRNGAQRLEVKVEENGIVGMPQDPEMEGYEFIGWYLDGKEFDFLTHITKDITILAYWKQIDVIINYYTVDFDSNGGSYVESMNLEEGTVVIRPKSPTKDGFDFIGWYLDGVLYDFSLPVTKNITLVAGWNQKEPVYFTVSFDSYGGSEVKAQTVVENGFATEIYGYERDGFEFLGWYLDGALFDFDTPITRDITLTAKWRGDFDITQLVGVWTGNENVDGVVYAHTVTVCENGDVEWKYKTEFTAEKAFTVCDVYCDGLYVIFEITRQTGMTARAVKFTIEGELLIAESCFFGGQCVFSK